jgi:hypothetical protein
VAFLVKLLLMILFVLVGLAQRARYFFLLSQEKVSKKKATPYRLFLALLALMGGKRKLAKRLAQTAACRKLPSSLCYSAR